jgi:UDP-N-acetylmuramate--alanine ligase
VRLGNLNRVHFVGIGGIGMSGIAEVLLTQGFTVTGSDAKETAVIQRLRARGAKVAVGHDGANLGGAQVLVYSSAVSPQNPEVLAARSAGIPVIPRAEMLAELMRLKSSVAVAGSHGKTTVTAMVAHLAHSAGLDPTVVIGGRLSTLDASARLGSSDLLVAEADESDRSFLLLYPSLAVITNIDWEHVDCYPDLHDLKEAFLQFANRVPFYGSCVACADDANVRDILPRFTRRVITYGLSEHASFRAERLPAQGPGETFRLVARGEDRGIFTVPQSGAHIVLNALAALAVGEELGIPFDTLRGHLATFPGADRRFQFRGEAAGVRVVDDYGHHPTEIAATFDTARRVAGDGRVVVLFQPHRYTRLAALAEDFARVLSQADLVVVTEVYAASEAPIAGVTGSALADRVKGVGKAQAYFCGRVEDLPAFVASLLQAGDLVLTLGAGTITTVGPALLDRLGRDYHGR